MSKMLLWHSKYISDKSGGFSRYLMTNPLVRRWGYSLNMLLLLICSIKRFDMYPVGKCGIATYGRQNVSTSEQVWQLIMSTSSRFMSSSMVRYLAKALEPSTWVCHVKRGVNDQNLTKGKRVRLTRLMSIQMDLAPCAVVCCSKRQSITLFLLPLWEVINVSYVNLFFFVLLVYIAYFSNGWPSPACPVHIVHNGNIINSMYRIHIVLFTESLCQIR